MTLTHYEHCTFRGHFSSSSALKRACCVLDQLQKLGSIYGYGAASHSHRADTVADTKGITQGAKSRGLKARDLIGIASSNPCTTTTKLDNLNKHRDHAAPGHPALTHLAKEHDAMFKATFAQLFRFFIPLLPRCLACSPGQAQFPQ